MFSLALTEMDDSVGQILAALKEAGQEEVSTLASRTRCWGLPLSLHLTVPMVPLPSL